MSLMFQARLEAKKNPRQPCQRGFPKSSVEVAWEGAG
jgi:hypothetical protein